MAQATPGAFFVALAMAQSSFAATAADAADRSRAQSGIASVYSHQGLRTASGETLRSEGFTAAHRSLPFGTMVKVTNRRNGRSVTVRINDRGPFVESRIIDLTPVAAGLLGFSGLAPVTVEVVGG